MLALAQQTADTDTSRSPRRRPSDCSPRRRPHADAHLTDAQAQRRSTVAEAQARAEHLDRDSTGRASQLCPTPSNARTTITAQFEQRKEALEKRVEQLRTFEREYRVAAEELPGVAAAGSGRERSRRAGAVRTGRRPARTA